MVLRVLRPVSIVWRPLSGVRRPMSSVRSISPTVLKIISPCCIHIFVMYVGCAQKIIVAPLMILELFAWAKVVFNILIFFSETTSRWRLILCHYIP